MPKNSREQKFRRVHTDRVTSHSRPPSNDSACHKEANCKIQVVVVPQEPQSHSYLVCAHVKLSLASARIAVQPLVDHGEYLLHDGVLSKVILTLWCKTSGERERGGGEGRGGGEKERGRERERVGREDVIRRPNLSALDPVKVLPQMAKAQPCD